MNLLEAVKATQEAREKKAALAAQLKVRRQQFEAEIEDLVLDFGVAEMQCEDAEKALRQQGLDVFNALHDPNVGYGVKVRMLTRLEYDEGWATEWAKINATVLLRLDFKAFEKLAKEQKLPGVRIFEEPQVTIASDLAAELAKVPAGGR